MRKRKIIVVVSLVLLLGGVGAMFLSRDSGPPVKVEGDLSAKDAAQIKRAVRRRLWHDVFPNFSKQTLKELPGMTRLAWTAHIIRIEGDQHRATAYFSGSGVGINIWRDGYELTNGTTGWRWINDHLWIVAD